MERNGGHREKLGEQRETTRHRQIMGSMRELGSWRLTTAQGESQRVCREAARGTERNSGAWKESVTVKWGTQLEREREHNMFSALSQDSLSPGHRHTVHFSYALAVLAPHTYRSSLSSEQGQLSGPAPGDGI